MTLHEPVKNQLRHATDSAVLDRVWERVQAQRTKRARVRVNARRAVVLTAMAACVLLAVMGVRSLRARPTVNANSSTQLAALGGPLRVKGGDALRAGPLTDTRANTVVFHDGSSVTVSPGTRLEALANDGHSVVFLLVRGRAHFEVTPGGPRRWSVECGLGVVDVVGTGFTLERSDAGLRVDVDHGVVLAHSDAVPDRVRRLGAGESLFVPSAWAKPGETRDAGTALAAIEPRAHDAGTHKTHALLAATSHTPAIAEHDAGVPIANTLADAAVDPPREPTVTELLDRADDLRRAGRVHESAELLERIVRDHAGDASAGLAAFMLGRVAADGLRDHARAARAFARALELGLPRALVDDARTREADERARIGNAP